MTVAISYSCLIGLILFSSSQVSAQHSVDGLKGIDKLIMDYLEQHSDM